MGEMKTFREAYGVLQEHAQTLRDQTEPNIDELLDIVTESVTAYKVCKDRIDAVEKALKDALTSVDAVPARSETAPLGDGGPPRDEPTAAIRPARRVSAGPASPAKPPGTSGFDAMDDDIPF